MIRLDFLTIKEFIKDVFKYALVILGVLLIVIYIVTLEQVVGPSMSPTLKDGDIVILNKFSYKFNDIKRGDIVSLNYADTKYLIKRVIGLPGEYVAIKDNKVYIGDKILKEYYLKDVEMKDFTLNDLGYDVIPKNKYLVLGDNRGNSLDSRDQKVGLIDKKDIVGKVKLRIWPLNKMGVIN